MLKKFYNGKSPKQLLLCQCCMSYVKFQLIKLQGYSLEQAQVVGIVGIVGMVGIVGIIGINKYTDS